MKMRTVLLPRRGFLLGLAGGAALGLSGCGFELRKAPIFAFKSIAVSGRSALVNQVRRNLRAAGTVTVLPGDDKSAEAVLDILADDRERLIVSTNSVGLLREIQLVLKVRFRLHAQGGKDLLAATEIVQTRDLTYNETNALAKEGEADLLFRDMQIDLAQQLVRRLGAVKAL